MAALALHLSFDSEVARSGTKGDGVASSSPLATLSPPVSLRSSRSSSSSSLDRMIASFRASGSSMGAMSASAARVKPLLSPPRRSARAGGRAGGQASKVKRGDVKTEKLALRAPLRRDELTKQACEREDVGRRSRKVCVDDTKEPSPMPQLVHAPRTKPSQLLRASVKSTKVMTERKPVQRLRQCQVAPRISNGIKGGGQGSSSQSSDDDEDSIDRLINQDLKKLNCLVANASPGYSIRGEGAKRSKMGEPEPARRPGGTNGETSDALQRRARFRDEPDVSGDGGVARSPKTVSSRRSSFRLFPTTRHAIEKARDETRLPNKAITPRYEDEDALLEELNTLKSKLQIEQDTQRKKNDANDKTNLNLRNTNTKHKDNQEATKVSESINGMSLRDVADKIDKTLLLALRPFQQMEAKEIDDQEMVTTKAYEELLANKTELPIAAKGIVNLLEKEFGNETRLRQEESDAKVAADKLAKVEASAKQKEDDEEKAAAKLQNEKREKEILSLIPLGGKLLSSSSDVEDALWRLEEAEARLLKRRTINGENNSALISKLMSPSEHDGNVSAQLALLKEQTLRKIQQLEAKITELEEGGTHHPAENNAFHSTALIDLRRKTFQAEVTECQPVEPVSDATDTDSELLEQPCLGNIVQQEVVEKLDLAIMRLRHVLGIDCKEAHEIEEARLRQEEKVKHEEQVQAEENERKKKYEADAELAQQRVMGISSLEELTWITEEEFQLQKTLPLYRATADILEDTRVHAIEKAALDNLEIHNEGRRPKHHSAFSAALSNQKSVFDQHQSTDGKSPGRPSVYHRRTRGPRSNNRAAGIGGISSSESESEDCAPVKYPSFGRPPRTGDLPTRSVQKWTRGTRSKLLNEQHARRAIPSARITRQSLQPPTAKLQRMMHTIQTLQADRREKSNWFRQSNHLD